MIKVQSWLDPVQTYSGESYSYNLGYLYTIKLSEDDFKILEKDALFIQHLTEGHITINKEQ